MDYGYALLMFCIGGALLLYSVILIKTENISLVVQMDKDRIQNKKMYVTQYGKAVAILSLAPVVSGIFWLTGAVRRSVAFLVLGFILCVWEATEIMRKVK